MRERAVDELLEEFRRRFAADEWIAHNVISREGRLQVPFR
jgi:hypothetical protein